MKRAKRVRFQDRVSDRSRFENASAPSNSTEAPSSDNPKTAEFAFFKKFREDASLKHQSKSPPRENIQLKRSIGKNHGGGMADNKRTSKSSFLTENARPSKTDFLVSPQLVSSSLVKTSMRRNQEGDLAPSCLIKTPTTSGPDDFFLERATDLVRSDTRYMDGDIFSKKRAKLQSLVAKTMNPGNDEVLMGCDLISRLLNRLIPESFESNHCEAFKSKPDKEVTICKSLYLPESSYQLKESWNECERKLAKREKPYFMEADASSCLSNKIHRKFLLEELVQRACLPALECAEHMVLGHQYKEVEPCYFSNIDYKRSWNGNSKTDRPRTLKDTEWPCFRSLTTLNEQASSLPRSYVGTKSKSCAYPSNKETYLIASWETDLPTTTSVEKDLAEGFLEANGNSYGSFGTFNTRRMPLEYDPVQEHSLNDDDPSSSWNYRSNASPFMDNYGNRFLLEYEKKEPESIADINSGSMFGNSPGNCRSSALTTFVESDELDDDSGHLRLRRKTPDLLLSWDIDKPKEKEIRYSFPVDTRSDLPLTISYELIPAADNFAFSPSQQCLLPQRSHYLAIEAPVRANSSPYLLLEGGEDELRQTSVVGETCNDYSTTSMSRFSDNELLWPKQIQRLDWRDNDEEMYVL